MRKHTYFGILESGAIGFPLLLFSLFLGVQGEDTAAEGFSSALLIFSLLFLLINVISAYLSRPLQVWNLGPSAVGLLKDSGLTIEINQGQSVDDLEAIRTIRGTYLLASTAAYIAYPDGSVRKGSFYDSELLVPLELTMARLYNTPVDYEQAALQPLVGSKVIGLRRFIYCGLAAALLALAFTYWDTCWEKYYTWQVEQAPGVSVASINEIDYINDRESLDLTIKKGWQSLAFKQLHPAKDDVGANIQIAAVDGMYLYDSMAFINPSDETCLNQGGYYNRQLMHNGLDIGTKGVHRFLVDSATFNPKDLTELSGHVSLIRQWLQKVPTWPNTYNYVGGYYENDYYMGYQPLAYVQVKHYLFKSRVKRNANL